MALERPTNWVTRELASRVTTGGERAYTDFPDITKAQRDWLVRTFPPKCYDPSRQSLEEHLQYAGVSGFAMHLVSIFDEKASPDGEVADPTLTGERA